MDKFALQGDEGKMREITTLKLIDVKSNSEAVLIIRTAGKELALCLSLLKAGDIEVQLSSENVKQLIHGLETALSSVI